MTNPTNTADVRAAAQAVVDRWDTPLWKDAPATAGYIGRLRATLAVPAQPVAEQANADSVQEEAARLDFLIEQRAYVVSDPDDRPGHWLHWARPDGSTWVQGDEHPTPRAAIDAGRKQGGA